MQAVGYNEPVPNEEEYDKIKHFLKVSHLVPLKMVEQVATAQYESNYFRRLGNVVGAATFPLFFKFPVVRSLPGLQRIGAALLMSGILYGHLNYLANSLEETRGNRFPYEVVNVWRRFIVHHNGHPKIFN